MATPTSSPDSLQAHAKIEWALYNNSEPSSLKLTSRKRIVSLDSVASTIKCKRRRCTVKPALQSPAPAAHEDDGLHWYGERVAQEAACAKWGRKYGTSSPLHTAEGLQVYDGADVAAHYQAVEVEDIGRVCLGDFVEIQSDQHDDQGNAYRSWIMEITELFEDVEGGKYFTGHWFYSLWNTSLVVTTEQSHGRIKQEDPVSLEPHRIFRASGHDNSIYAGHNQHGNTQSLQTITKRVTVKHVKPGCGDPGNCDYWWNLEHDRRFFTFIDKYPAGCGPEFKTKPVALPRKLEAVDLYCGCGGMSFVDHKTKQVQIQTRWAVDSAKAMCLSFEANYPDAKVSCMGVDEWLMLCIKFKALSDRFPDTWGPPDEGEEAQANHEQQQQEEDEGGKRARLQARGKRRKTRKPKRAMKGSRSKQPGSDEEEEEEENEDREWEVEEILDVRIADNAQRGTTGMDKGNLLEALREDNCWLQFKVKWKGWSSGDRPDGTTWEDEDLLSCDELLFEYVQDVRQKKLIPLPGDIDIVMGGPPCQGVTGLNRHAVRNDIRDDSRNRLQEPFYAVVMHFQPSFVLMENVVDTLRKEDGMYAKSAMGSLLLMKYQVRMGIIAACDQGVPQARNRVFMWGARSGVEQLPPFPEPSHDAVKRRHHVPAYVKDLCVVDFQSPRSRRQALPLPVLGDIFSDLPEISSFTFSESAHYKTATAQTPYQHFLRRPPPFNESSQEARAAAAEAFMTSCRDAERRKIHHGQCSVNGVEKVGAMFACRKHAELHMNQSPAMWESPEKKKSGKPSPRKKQRVSPWKLMLEECQQESGLEEVEARKQEAADATKALHYQIGRQVLESVEAAARAKGLLRDHRSLLPHLDDHLRICHIAKEKGASFRSLPGVVSWANRTCCAGHTHAARFQGHQTCPGAACPSRNVFLPTAASACPYFPFTYKQGRSSGSTACYGRLWYDEIRCTVLGRAEPHNLTLLHPNQDRVVSVRENARMQGFPDYFALVGLGKQPARQGAFSRNRTLEDRYQQMGNAVSPCVASALGRCLALAAVGGVPGDLDHAVVAVPDPVLHECWKKSRGMGLQTYTEQQASKSGSRVTSAPEDEEESSSAQLQPQSWSECGEDEEELQCELKLDLDDEGEADSEADNEAAEEIADLTEERGTEGANIIERAEQDDDGDVQSVLELCLDDDDEEEAADDSSLEEEKESLQGLSQQQC